MRKRCGQWWWRAGSRRPCVISVAGAMVARLSIRLFRSEAGSRCTQARRKENCCTTQRPSSHDVVSRPSERAATTKRRAARERAAERSGAHPAGLCDAAGKPLGQRGRSCCLSWPPPPPPPSSTRYEQTVAPQTVYASSGGRAGGRRVRSLSGFICLMWPAARHAHRESAVAFPVEHRILWRAHRGGIAVTGPAASGCTSCSSAARDRRPAAVVQPRTLKVARSRPAASE